MYAFPPKIADQQRKGNEGNLYYQPNPKLLKKSHGFVYPPSP